MEQKLDSRYFCADENNMDFNNHKRKPPIYPINQAPPPNWNEFLPPPPQHPPNDSMRKTSQVCVILFFIFPILYYSRSNFDRLIMIFLFILQSNGGSPQASRRMHAGNFSKPSHIQSSKSLAGSCNGYTPAWIYTGQGNEHRFNPPPSTQPPPVSIKHLRLISRNRIILYNFTRSILNMYSINIGN